jgi:hypothetical protein
MEMIRGWDALTIHRQFPVLRNRHYYVENVNKIPDQWQFKALNQGVLFA